MKKIQNSLGLIFFLVLFVVTNMVFNKLYMYDYFDWLDICMHVLGGMLFIWSWYHLHTEGEFRKIVVKPLLHPLLVLLILVIGWEVCRYFLKDLNMDGYVLDTTLDIIVGMSGGIIAYLWFSSRTIEK